MKTKSNFLRSEKGFTLVEIVAVLLIMGVLTAVAVQKFIGFTTEAEARAVDAAVAELNGRANVQLARWMLDNSQDPRGFTTELGADFSMLTNTTMLFKGQSYLLTYMAPSTSSLATATPASWAR